MIDEQILHIVARLQRSYARVYPYMVQARLPYYRAEQTLRRDMVRLAEAGWLVRVGGPGARRGYVMPPKNWGAADIGAPVGIHTAARPNFARCA